MTIEERRKYRREYMRRWSAKNRQKVKVYRDRHYRSEKSKRWRAEWRQHNRPRLAEWARNSRRKIRREALDAYGGKCKCCGEMTEVFLAIDHIDGKGANHRREINSKSGTHFYWWLKRNGWPKGFQVLCHNCNWAKHQLGECPHQSCKSN